MKDFFKLLVFSTSIWMFSGPACALEGSLTFECNEEASTIGMSATESRFGRDYEKHPGWSARSPDGKYRVWTVPAGLSILTFEWQCRIDGKDAVLKVWHQTTPKDELIDKYGIGHERCGAFRRLRLTYGGKVILQDVWMSSDECKNVPFVVRSVYFGKPLILPRGLATGYEVQGMASKNGYATFGFHVNNDLDTFFYPRKNKAKLPIGNDEFDSVVLGANR